MYLKFPFYIWKNYIKTESTNTVVKDIYVFSTLLLYLTHKKVKFVLI